MDDASIVDLYWARSDNAIKETASKYGKYCYAIANNILFNSEDADESVNDTYWGAWNSMPPHRPSVLSSFLGKITRRISLNKWRDRHRERRGGGEVSIVLDELEDCLPSDYNLEEEILAAEMGMAINSFLIKLPDAERRVFICRYWYLDPISAICKQFGFSESKVKSMLHRTRSKLSLYLAKEGLFNDN